MVGVVQMARDNLETIKAQTCYELGGCWNTVYSQENFTLPWNEAAIQKEDPVLKHY